VTAAAGAGAGDPGVTTRRRKGEVMAATAHASGRRGAFEVDPGRAAEALALTWGELYQDIAVDQGRWQARNRNGDGRGLTGNTPGELAARMRGGLGTPEHAVTGRRAPRRAAGDSPAGRRVRLAPRHAAGAGLARRNAGAPVPAPDTKERRCRTRT